MYMYVHIIYTRSVLPLPILSQRVCVYTGALSGIDDAECGCDGCLCNSDAESVDGTCQQVTIHTSRDAYISSTIGVLVHIHFPPL